MASLNTSNARVDKNSGAILYKRSDELKLLIAIQKEVKGLSEKVDLLTKTVKDSELRCHLMNG